MDDFFWVDGMPSAGGHVYYHGSGDRVSRDVPEVDPSYPGIVFWDSANLDERLLRRLGRALDLRVWWGRERGETPIQICLSTLSGRETARELLSDLTRSRSVMAAHLHTLQQTLPVDRIDLLRMVPYEVLLEYFRLRRRAALAIGDGLRGRVVDDALMAGRRSVDFQLMSLGGVRTPQGIVRTAYDWAPMGKPRVSTRPGWPDMMSIPKEGRRDRPPFSRDDVTPLRSDARIVSLDLIAADLRSLTWMSKGDGPSMSVYLAVDPYGECARQILGEKVKGDEPWARDLMKRMVVPRIYGGSPEALQGELSIENSRKLCDRIDGLFDFSWLERPWEHAQRCTTDFMAMLVGACHRHWDFMRPMFTVHDELILECWGSDAVLAAALSDEIHNFPCSLVPAHRVRARSGPSYGAATRSQEVLFTV